MAGRPGHDTIADTSCGQGFCARLRLHPPRLDGRHLSPQAAVMMNLTCLHRFAPGRFVVAAAVAAACLALDASAARLALVVGNDAYQTISKLKNARNDANTMARELEAAGFKVTRVLDATRERLNNEFDGFVRRLEKGDEVVFFFSGHGSQPPQAGPFLLPVDIKVGSDHKAILRDGFSLETAIEELNQRARFSLFIIDACRDDPFRQTVAGRSLPSGSGLARIEPPDGTLVIMAASKGQQALDRLSDNDPVANGLFTRELVKQMRTRGLPVTEMLRKVRTNVVAAANSVNHKQKPSLTDESSSDFFFYPGSAQDRTQDRAQPVPAPEPQRVREPDPVPVPAPARQQEAVRPVYTAPAAVAPAPSPAAASISDAQRELDAWDAAERTGTRSALEGFVARYPDGRYTPRARTKLAGMAPAAVTAPAPAARPAATAAHNPQAEFEVWDRASTSKRKADYEAYLQQYPNGRYVDLVRAALKKL